MAAVAVAAVAAVAAGHVAVAATAAPRKRIQRYGWRWILRIFPTNSTGRLRYSPCWSCSTSFCPRCNSTIMRSSTAAKRTVHEYTAYK